jgi:predicted outer membrane repeat protein
MHRKPVRVAARAIVLGGILVLGLGSAQAAMAGSPTTVYVPCDVGDLSLAISDASGGETIFLAQGCVYHLAAALPDVMVDMTIIGNDAELLRDERAPSFSLLTVGKAIHLTVISVNFKNGGGPDDDYGGAIYNDYDSDLTVHDGIFTGNYSHYEGGAIDSADGSLKVTDAYFIDNSTRCYGGAIYSVVAATVAGNTFKSNHTNDYSGGAIYNYDDMQLAGNTFVGNSSYRGGAIYNDWDMQATGNTFMDNHANYSGGAIYNEHTLVMNRNDLTWNTAAWGGGIYNNDKLTVYSNLIAFNRASDHGGGIYNHWRIEGARGNRIVGNWPGNCVHVTGCIG